MRTKTPRRDRSSTATAKKPTVAAVTPRVAGLRRLPSDDDDDEKSDSASEDGIIQISKSNDEPLDERKPAAKKTKHTAKKPSKKRDTPRLKDPPRFDDDGPDPSDSVRAMTNSAPDNKTDDPPTDLAMTNSAPNDPVSAAAQKAKSHASVPKIQRAHHALQQGDADSESENENGDDDSVTTPSVESLDDANDSDFKDDTAESPPATPNARKKRKTNSAPSPNNNKPDKASETEKQQRSALTKSTESKS